MQTSLGGTENHSRDLPSEGSTEMVVVKADDVTSTEVVSAIDSLETQAQQRSGLFEGEATVEVSSDQTVATMALPTTGNGTNELSNWAVDPLRDDWSRPRSTR